MKDKAQDEKKPLTAVDLQQGVRRGSEREEPESLWLIEQANGGWITMRGEKTAREFVENNLLAIEYKPTGVRLNDKNA